MNKMALTERIHALVRKTGLPFNALLTHFFLEAVLCKLTGTQAGKLLVLKGGVLLSNHLGIRMRSTIDIDFLLRNSPLNEENIRLIVDSICVSIAVPEVSCSLHAIEPIREQDEYGGFRAKVLCRLENIRETISLDFATGDPITPGPVDHVYKAVFFQDDMVIASYSIPTILAEKIETICRLGLLNGRSKDFYDVHSLWLLHADSMDLATLALALQRTFEYRGTALSPEKLLTLLDDINNDASMQIRWSNWTKRNPYAAPLSFSAVIQSIRALATILTTQEHQYNQKTLLP